jgi:hypothetical protein
MKAPHMPKTVCFKFCLLILQIVKFTEFTNSLDGWMDGLKDR